LSFIGSYCGPRKPAQVPESTTPSCPKEQGSVTLSGMAPGGVNFDTTAATLEESFVAVVRQHSGVRIELAGQRVINADLVDVAAVRSHR
jgi:hypothetical protein